MGKYISVFIRKNIGRIILILLLLLLIAISTSAMPYFSAKLIDEGLSAGETERVLINAAYILAIQVAISIIYVIVEHNRLNLYNKIHTSLKRESIDKLFKLPISFFNKKSSTAVYQQLEEDILTVSGCFSYEVIMPISYIFVTLFLIPVLISISVKLTLVTFACIPFYLAMTYVFSKLGYKYSKIKIEAENDYSICVDDTVSGMQTIRLFGLKKYFFDQFLKKQHTINASTYKLGMFQNINIQSEGAFTNIIGFVIYVIGGWLIAGKELSLGEFVSFETYSISVLSFVRQVLSLISGYFSLKPSIDRLSSFFNEPNESQDGIPLSGERINIKFDIKSFGYTKSSELLKKVYLTIPQGKHIAFIGENGCGKTTLINLLLRFYPVNEGKIFINEQDVCSYNLDSYRSVFVVLPQEPYLFCDTIKNNICLYKDVPEDKLYEAVKLSGLNKLIEEKSLNYCIGRNGCELSGGQRQRISIARSIVLDAPVVIFDEPEVNMDADFKNILASLLNGCFKDKTVIMITHNTTVIDLFDETYQFEHQTVHRIQ